MIIQDTILFPAIIDETLAKSKVEFMIRDFNKSKNFFCLHPIKNMVCCSAEGLTLVNVEYETRGAEKVYFYE